MQTYLAILLSAILTAVVAITSLIITVRTNRANTKKAQTITMLMQFHWDKDYIASRKIFQECRDGGGIMSCVTNATLRSQVAQIINHYEIMSIGVNKGILSDDIFRAYFRSRLVKDFQQSRLYIEHVRDEVGNVKIYREFEILAERWSKAP
ncbi:MAG: DUF4760 domain-containing protein [Pseudomonadota bacterium]